MGKLVAEKAISKGIKAVVFDRGGHVYHGRIKALADAARKGPVWNFAVPIYYSERALAILNGMPFVNLKKGEETG